MEPPLEPPELEDLAEAVDTREDLVRFLYAFERDLQLNPGSWENGSLASFLAALARWSESMDNYYLNTGQEIPVRPSWRTFADMMLAARIYE